MTGNAQAVEHKLEIHEKKDEAEVAGVQNQIVEHEQEDEIKWELTQAEFQALAEEQKQTREMVSSLLERLPPTASTPMPAGEQTESTPPQESEGEPTLAIDSPPIPAQTKRSRKRKFGSKRQK